MTFSVLMSVYKAEIASQLNRALQSVWDDQSLKPDEIVLIQDGLLGVDLQQIILNWKKNLGEKLVILKNETNIGLTKSLNKGISYIHTDCIARMDSDDISDPLRFERQIAFLEKHPDIDVLGGALQEFDEKNECLNIRHYPSTPELCKSYISKASPLAHPTVMMRRRIFDSGIRYNEKYKICQDIDLWFRLLSLGYKFANLEERTIFFRRNTTLLSRRRSFQRAYVEFRIYMTGIYSLKGLYTWQYIYPFARFGFRLLPPFIIKWIYGGHLRNKLLN